MTMILISSLHLVALGGIALSLFSNGWVLIFFKALKDKNLKENVICEFNMVTNQKIGYFFKGLLNLKALKFSFYQDLVSRAMPQRSTDVLFTIRMLWVSRAE